ncbi:MAG: glycosyltransferase [Candidatus Binatia bacterium]
MRILQVVHGFPPREWAGTELVTLSLSQALRVRGHQVTIFTRTDDSEAPEFSLKEGEVDGLPIVRVVNNYTSLSDFHLLYDSPFFDSVFLRFLDQTQPEIVHFQHLQHLSVRLLSLAAALGYPTVLTLHDFFFACHLVNLINTEGRLCAGPERGEKCVACLQASVSPDEARQRFFLMEQALQRPDIILTPSAFLAQKITDFFPSLQNKVRVIPLGVKAVPQIAKKCTPGGPLRILYVGVLSPHKGVHVLVEALQGLAPDTFTASVYGATIPAQRAYAERVHELARGLPMHFYDAYQHDQLGSILAQHDVLVMPAIWEETFSLLTREALMAGLPVIAARRGALPEAIQEGKNGFLFEPESAGDLQRCLARLIAEPDALGQLRASSTSVKTIEKYAEEIADCYARISTDREWRQKYNVQEKTRSSAHHVLLGLSVENAALRHDRDRLLQEHNRLRQERDRLLKEREGWLREQRLILEDRELIRAAAKEFEEILDIREDQLLERNARLETIYASTTWKLYQCYEALSQALVFRPMNILRRWLGK